MITRVTKMNLWRSIIRFGLYQVVRYKFRLWLNKSKPELIFKGGMDYSYQAFKRWARHKSSNDKYKIYAKKII